MVLKPLEMTKSRVVGLIAEKAFEAGISPNLALQVAFCESSYNPKAVSKNGAKGLFQFKDRTWSYCKGNVFDPEANLDCFLKLWPKHKSWWQCKG